MPTTDLTPEVDDLEAVDDEVDAKDAVDVAADLFKLEGGLDDDEDVTVGINVRGNRSDGSPAGT